VSIFAFELRQIWKKTPFVLSFEVFNPPDDTQPIDKEWMQGDDSLAGFIF
jgi:hypothetical protein